MGFLNKGSPPSSLLFHFENVSSSPPPIATGHVLTARLVHAEEAKQLQTDLVSAGVEEVAQTHDVAVVQLSHDLQLAVLEDKKGRKEKQPVSVAFRIHGSSGKSPVHQQPSSVTYKQQQKLNQENIRDSATSVVEVGVR